MTPEQRKRAAEVVTGDKWYIAGNGVFLVGGGADGEGYLCPILWKPSFVNSGDDCDRQRSQALAVVEWLYSNRKKEIWYVDIGKAIEARDIESLLRLVLELSDEP